MTEAMRKNNRGIKAATLNFRAPTRRGCTFKILILAPQLLRVRPYHMELDKEQLFFGRSSQATVRFVREFKKSQKSCEGICARERAASFGVRPPTGLTTLPRGERTHGQRVR